MKTTILIVDDDKEIAELLQFYLDNEGYNVFQALNGEGALKIIFQQSIDLLILDIMMPKMDGLEVCRKVRETKNTPILMLSAKVEDMDKIIGLTTGADDYMEKPFNPLEVVARVKALLRRVQMQTNQTTQASADQLFVRSLVINKKSHIVQSDGDNIELTPLEFQILFLLASHPSRVYSSEEIFEHVWQEDAYGISKTVMIHISNLRKKLEEATGEKVIETVWGVGYKIDS